ncbi:hypothetical protein SAMN02910369_00799 [Lachnospiraceae bacterium NE2001]|nr:hypothetical protein SAMN02910369_00799 [Lachnospiraceae bacterium NE2001]
MEKIVENVSSEKIKDFDLIPRFFEGKRVCMFDIETTGLSPEYSFTYIIGVNLFVDGQWQIIQLFNDDGKSEPEMIETFGKMIQGYDVLVEFNGDRFDIPYIQKRIHMIKRKLGISIKDPFADIISFDLMKCIKPYKYALGLPNIKQKTIEKYLGIDRVDMYNGGQLIDVYLEYLSMKSERNKELVLRHNRDDMEGMLYLGAVLGIDAISKGFLGDIRYNVSNNEDSLVLDVNAMLDYCLIKPIFTSVEGSSIEAEGNRLRLKLPIYVGSLKYYYGTKESDGFEVKDGYFVPSFVDYKGKCSVYREMARAKSGFIMLDDSFLGNEQLIYDYISHAICAIMHSTLR